jgi:hypothetical protein
MRDAEATARMLEAGSSEGGAVLLLRFLARLEARRMPSTSSFSYVALHPDAASRLATVTAEVARRAPASPPP